MEQNNDRTEDRFRFSDKQKQELKKYLVFGLLFILFLGGMWLIFKPSVEEGKEEQIGLNTDIPEPGKMELEDSKKNAYEQDYLRQKQKDKIKKLNNLALLVGRDTLKDSIQELKEEPIIERQISLEAVESDNRVISANSIQGSVDCYQKTNDALRSFYTTSESETEEVQRLKDEVKNLKEQIQDKTKETGRLEEQTALMERSYQLAAKYFPKSQTDSFSQVKVETNDTKITPANIGEKMLMVSQLNDDVISALPQSMTNDELREIYSKERNTGFHSADYDNEKNRKNTIPACIDRDQVIIEGQSISLRLLVPVQAGNFIIPKNSLISGKGSIQGERLYITISSIEHLGIIMEVALKVYDLDGQIGLSVRDVIEVSSIKEIAGNMGGNLGTSITLTKNAGQQVASDLSKSLIQGISQYIQNKVKVEKVNLKAGYRLLLLADKN